MSKSEGDELKSEQRSANLIFKVKSCEHLSEHGILNHKMNFKIILIHDLAELQ